MMNKKVAVVADISSKAASVAYAQIMQRYNFLTESQIQKSSVDVIIAIGGDGLMLKALHRYMDHGVAFYGLNRGSIGFLMNHYVAEELIERIDNATTYNLVPLEMISTDINGSVYTQLAINEVSLLRETNQAAQLQITVNNDVKLDKLVCDGILVSSPAGSTAYNFAANGPILPLSSNLLAMTPIAPFRPRRWRGAILTNRDIIHIKNIDPHKRPISAAADFHESRDIAEVTICTKPNKTLRLLFDKQNNIEDRILKEMFAM